METVARIRASNRLVRVLLHLLILALFKVSKFIRSINFLSALRECSGSLKYYPHTLVVYVAVQLSYTLKLRDNDAMDSYDVAHVHDMRQHASIVREKLNRDEGLRLRSSFRDCAIIFAGAI